MVDEVGLLTVLFAAILNVQQSYASKYMHLNLINEIVFFFEVLSKIWNPSEKNNFIKYFTIFVFFKYLFHIIYTYNTTINCLAQVLILRMIEIFHHILLL